MPQLRLALAQLDLTVGDVTANAEKILRACTDAAAAGAHVIAFPEMALTGYPVEDLALRGSFQAASRAALEALADRLAAAGLGHLLVIVGYLDSSPQSTPRVGRPAGSPQNAAGFLHGGRVIARYAKHHLPNYGVFDEYRYFLPGAMLPVVRFGGVDIAVAICEDLWQEKGPVTAAAQAGAGLLIVINSSPYEMHKDDTRLELSRRRAAEAGCTLAYVNIVGGQDELVFDGDSLIVTTDGAVLARAPQFEETIALADLDLPLASETAREPAEPEVPGRAGELAVERIAVAHDLPTLDEPIVAGVADRLADEAEVYAALVTGLRDYVVKNGFRSVVMGVSGGIDSALTAALACDALGAAAVHGVSLPSAYSSEHSRDDAEDLARRTGLHYRVVPIAPMVDGYLGQLALSGLAEENLQARVRGTTLMALSNSEGHLVLTTGNKSELACGYSTLYGDAVGGFAPLKDVPKSLVWQLARWRNKAAEERGETPPIPENSITKPPSAELRPGQLDTDSLPPYELLDDILDDYVERDLSRDQIVAAGFDAALVDRVIALVDTAEYKRRQYPPGPKISLKAFGRDRRLPITNRWRET